MSISRSAGRSYQIKYIRAYLSTRTLNGYSSYSRIPDRYIVNSSIEKSSVGIDSNDFDIGFYEESNFSVTFDNEDGKFVEAKGYFEGKLIDRSKIKIIAGYYNTDNCITNDENASCLTPEYATVFEGIIDDRGTSYDLKSETARFTVVSFSSIIKRLKTQSGVITTGMTIQQSIFAILNRSEVTDLLTLDTDNISTSINETIDDGTWFSDTQLDEALNKLLLAGNAAIKIVDNIIYISPRTQSDTVRFEFFGKGSPNAKVNILDIKDYNNGYKRVMTRLKVNDTTTYDSDSWIQEKYGSVIKELDIGFITDTDKTAIVANNILSEFQIPKPEMELTTDFLANEVELLDMVTIKNEGYSDGEQPAVYGTAVYGADTYVKMRGGIILDDNYGYKILKIEHDYKKYTTKLKLRMIGRKEGDGYIASQTSLYGSSLYGVSVYV